MVVRRAGGSRAVRSQGGVATRFLQSRLSFLLTKFTLKATKILLNIWANCLLSMEVYFELQLPPRRSTRAAASLPRGHRSLGHTDRQKR